ncbi:uncharacterized protein LOC112567931 [Pomacea canaliculata]|uniref:uncharacterized protein LOC112567931 n=1 Tax=Pomacea canaliculata TaxID=400727 RepID=UPI000D73242B|nr:uncharacterized protein LOC112567931 [Pomacea canaliculata]XP_025100615.1 uncharacterized protein LOC112567931 [Pomacea canaliculata]
MIVILFFNLLFVLCATGNPNTECDASEMGKLTCKFSTNIHSTQTDFSVYFHSDKGHEELLVDCVWVDDELQCLTQEGFECKQPVSQIAEISLPSRFVNSSGTYKCIAGSGHGNVQSCQVGKRHQESQQEKKQEFIELENSNYPDDKGKSSLVPLYAAIGSTLGVIAVAAIILVLLVRRKIQRS